MIRPESEKPILRINREEGSDVEITMEMATVGAEIGTELGSVGIDVSQAKSGPVDMLEPGKHVFRVEVLRVSMRSICIARIVR